eukprot:CAMPEP_0174732832 /NCGR_PEP_ID=MMETSP1094-20130205/60104_1 /TAXON_ID=156173 /ORGANISM="Chrysochromulina brevifilum, Strain UTEX LB 985" /LENGTH=122 /DNA_ID=CAMNT_0015935385 /DNA_START=42 /DNA_END=411 /DNA_ORIENTATION=+
MCKGHEHAARCVITACHLPHHSLYQAGAEQTSKPHVAKAASIRTSSSRSRAHRAHAHAAPPMHSSHDAKAEDCSKANRQDLAAAITSSIEGGACVEWSMSDRPSSRPKLMEMLSCPSPSCLT